MYKEEREEKAKQTAKDKEEAAKRKRRCANARDRLRRYKRSSALYNPQADGSREYLSNEQRDKAIADTERDVARWCK